GEGLARAVLEQPPPPDVGRLAAEPARRPRQPALREREERGPGGREDRRDANRPGLRDVRGDERERAPREPEAEVGVDATAEQLEVVDGNQCRPDRDER